MNDLKIIGLSVENWQKLTAVNMTFPTDGGLIFFAGQNEQGKTSLIDFLWWMFEGNRVINPEKIQHGKDKIKGIVFLGDYTIERIYKKNYSKLEVKTANNKPPINNPAAFLAALKNKLTFNPFPFLNLTPENQLKFMMEFLNIDFSGIDSRLIYLEEDRRSKGRERDAFGEIPYLPEVKKIDIATLQHEKNQLESQKHKELNKIRDFNHEQEMLNLKKENAKARMESWQKKVNKLKEELLLAQDELRSAAIEYDKVPSPEPLKIVATGVDTTKIELEILNAERINNEHENWLKNEKKRKEKEEKVKQYEQLTKEIKALREQKKEILSKQLTGIPGLEVREDGLYYKGTFIANCSDSEKLKISMMLCKAQKPPLKAFFLDGAERFDNKRIQEIKAFAQENDIQVFLTQVNDQLRTSIPPNVFYICEGEVIGEK